MEKFSEILKNLRKEAGLTQNELATRLGYGYTAISNYEEGRNEPSLTDLVKFATEFKVSVDFLCGLENKEHLDTKRLTKDQILHLQTLIDDFPLTPNTTNNEINEIYFKSDFVIRNNRILEYWGGSKCITIPPDIKCIDNYAFENKNFSIAILKGLTDIGEGAFKACRFLKTVQFSETLINIGESAFYDCSSLKEIILPDSVLEIQNSAFEYCLALKKIKFPQKLKKISKHVVFGCEELIEIEIYDEVEEIGTDAFAGCVELEKVTCTKNSIVDLYFQINYPHVKRIYYAETISPVCLQDYIK